jgi:hypothetical protein
MALRNVALIKDGKVVNVAVVEDDPAQWPGYVRACNPPDVDMLEELAKHHDCDACVELHDGEMCEPGATLHPDAVELAGKVGVVRIARQAALVEGVVVGKGGAQGRAQMQATAPVADRFVRAKAPP